LVLIRFLSTPSSKLLFPRISILLTVGRSASMSAGKDFSGRIRSRATEITISLIWGLISLDSIAIDIVPADVYFPLVMSARPNHSTGSFFNVVDIAHRSSSPFLLPRTSAAMLILAVMLTLSFLPACQGKDPIEQQKQRSLSPDERYLVELYMKITEIEENLQDNPEALEEKRVELREEIDLERIGRILLELEQDPERWLAVYNRIFELQQRSEPKPSN
jgi:hypothetical protein